MSSSSFRCFIKYSIWAFGRRPRSAEAFALKRFASSLDSPSFLIRASMSEGLGGALFFPFSMLLIYCPDLLIAAASSSCVRCADFRLSFQESAKIRRFNQGCPSSQNKQTYLFNISCKRALVKLGLCKSTGGRGVIRILLLRTVEDGSLFPSLCHKAHGRETGPADRRPVGVRPPTKKSPSPTRSQEVFVLFYRSTTKFGAQPLPQRSGPGFDARSNGASAR